ncbi:MAG: hypothetical protein C4560_11115 [Nitrospiraceae bacterium]|nr:MAG: hypothetical protein C4560_11115 [Nitrospiraceae bacterium]
MQVRGNKMLKRKIIQLLLMLLVAGSTQPLFAQSGVKTQAYSASDGQGGARLLWFVSPDRWRGGWRVEDETGKVLADRILPGGADPMKALPAESQAEISSLLRNIREQGNKKRTAVNEITFGIKVFSNWDFARAAGLAIELKGLEKRRTSFVVRRLDDSGKPDTAYLKTEPVDLAKAAPMPPSPLGFRAEAEKSGIELYWRLARNPLPVFAYVVEREYKGELRTLTDSPLVLGSNWPEKSPAFVDKQPPLESDVVYIVRAVDALGRRSNPVATGIFSPDLFALDAPMDVKADAVKTNTAEVSWKANSSSNTAGYLVERSYQLSGPFEILTPEGVTPGTTSYKDKGLRPGTTYFYRVRAIGARGDTGPPGPAVMAVVRGEPVPAPENLTAEAGQTRVRLTWEAVAAASGYHVERRTGNERPWSRLTGMPVPDMLYDDHTGYSPGGRFEYRVLAAGYDGQDGKPSRPVEVMLQDTVSPAPPRFIEASGEGGKVWLTFAPAAPEEDTSQVLVLRADQPDQQGLVIGDPLSGRGRQFEDRWVEPGRRYYYRLVAVDASGNRSDPGEAVGVLVGHESLPRPDAPEAVYAGSPFPHVRLSFDEPPKGLRVLVEAQTGTGAWLYVAGPVTGREAIDLNPGKEAKRYRLRYQDAGGAAGPASKEAVFSGH